MRRDHFLLALLAFLFFIPFLGGVHLFDWDEINFAECSREMLLTGDYMRPQIDFQPFWEKPPLFLWLQVLSMQGFGVNEFAARLPNAVCGLATLLTVYEVGRRFYDRTFGLLWALGWLGSLLPHLYFRSGIIDPWFNFFIFTGLFGFIEFRWRFFDPQNANSFWARYRHLLLGGWLLGLGILTKGPTALLIALLVLFCYWVRYKFRLKGYPWHVFLFVLAALSVSLLWFGLEVALHGTWFVREFITYQIRLFSTPDAGHGGFFGYHAVVLFLGCFPMSVFALPNLWGDRQSEDELLESSPLTACKQADLTTWMQYLFWVVLILFSVVRTKIVHYSSLCYFPLTFLGALTIWRAVKWKVRPRWIMPVLLLVALILAGAVIAAPFAAQNTAWLKSLFAHDAFAVANLDSEVSWVWWQGLPGWVLLLGVLAGWWLWRKRQILPAAEVILGGGAIFTAFTLLFNINNIEAYSQRAAIEFYEGKAGEKCVVKVVGFKSYAHLFYTQKLASVGPAPDTQELKDRVAHSPGQLEYPVYWVAKINRLGDLPTLPNCRELYRKNGFVFFESK